MPAHKFVTALHTRYILLPTFNIPTMFISTLIFATFAVGTASATLTCNSVNTNEAYLEIATGNGGQVAGIRTGYNLSNATAAVNSTTAIGTNFPVLVNGSPYSGADNNFQFMACASTYLGYPASETVAGVPRWYGHITVPGLSNNCVTRHYVDYGHEFLTVEPCSTADDVTQELQYFRLIQLNDGYEAYQSSLNNIGHPAGTSGKIYYFAPGTDAAPAFTVQSDSATGYNLEFQYIHIN